MSPRPGSVRRSLARRRLGSLPVMFFVMSAAAPLTAVAGGTTTAFAVTGVVGFPLAYLLVALALALFAVGYVAMARYLTNAGAFYTYISHGLNRVFGVGASFLALIAYNAMAIGLQGLFGAALSGLLKDKLGLSLPWWLCSLFSLLVAGILGVRRIDFNARLLTVLLSIECLLVLAFDVAALVRPAHGHLDVTALSPHSLLVPALGGALAWTLGGFIGFESAATYGEEVRDPRRTVARATYGAIGLIAFVYALSSWAMTEATSPDRIVADSRQQGTALLFNLSGKLLGSTVTDVANVLFITSLFAALLSFHNAVARYLFALGRESVLPRFMSSTGRRSGAPVGGSLTQSLLALVVVGTFAVLGRDPVLDLFNWATSLSTVGVVGLMALTSIAVFGFFLRRSHGENVWRRALAPALSTVVLGGVLALMLANFNGLIGATRPTPLTWVLPGILAGVLVLGVGWGLVLKFAKPQVYQAIGLGAAGEVEEITGYGDQLPASPPQPEVPDPGQQRAGYEFPVPHYPAARPELDRWPEPQPVSQPAASHPQPAPRPEPAPRSQPAPQPVPPRYPGSRRQEPAYQQPGYQQPRYQPPQPAQPQPAQPQPAPPPPAQPRYQEARYQEPRYQEPRYREPGTAQPGTVGPAPQRPAAAGPPGPTRPDPARPGYPQTEQSQTEQPEAEEPGSRYRGPGYHEPGYPGQGSGYPDSGYQGYYRR